MRPLRQAGVWCAIVLAAGCCLTEAPAEEPTASVEQIEFFEKEVRPLLAENCHKCHGGQAKKGNLRLDSRSAVLAGGDTGPAVKPGKPDESLLIDAVSYGDLYQMPPAGKLADKQIAVLRRWVELAAPWPSEASPTAAAPATPAQFDLQERAKHWAFQPLDERALPQVENKSWPQSPSDTFLLPRMEQAGLTPVEPAAKPTLLRRASFDLIGLPPTAGEIEAFLADDGPDAFAASSTGCSLRPTLASVGAATGSTWLATPRARGTSSTTTSPTPGSTAITSSGRSTPTFPTTSSSSNTWPATCWPSRGGIPRPASTSRCSEPVSGFWVKRTIRQSICGLIELDHTDNKINVFSKTFLALTVACARCHDHKFDAIGTNDYYALAGYLVSGGYRQAPFDALDAERTLCRQLADLRAAHRSELLQTIHAATRPTRERLSELLLATRDVLQASGAEDSAAASRNRAVEAVAAARQVAPGELAQWVEAVRQAAGDATSPLHTWAVLAVARGEAAASPMAVVTSLLGPKADNAPDAPATIVVDYSALPEADWRQDGFAFGPGPLKPGDLSFGAAPSVLSAASGPGAQAVSDPFWDAATLAAGVEREPGRLSWLQSGRTLRTPTFTLGGGKLYYLVSGSGYAYAAVYSHRMNNGPLHGALVREWQAGERFQWIEHDLSAYRGQRVHVEFIPGNRARPRPTLRQSWPLPRSSRASECLPPRILPGPRSWHSRKPT